MRSPSGCGVAGLICRARRPADALPSPSPTPLLSAAPRRLQSLGETAGILGAQLSLQEALLSQRLAGLRRIAATQRAIKTELDAIYQRLRAARARLESKHAWAVREAERQVDLALGRAPRGEDEDDEEGAEDDGDRQEEAVPTEPPSAESCEEREERARAEVETWLREATWDPAAA